MELGQPEQLPCNSTLTIPSLNSLNFMSPPSLATAGLIFWSNNFTIFFSSSPKFSLDSSKSLSMTNSFPDE